MNSIQFVAETPSGVGFNEHSNTALRRGLVTYSDFRQTQIRRPQTRASRGGIDEINPEDIVYGEYSCDAPDNSDEYIDLIYLDGDILRTFSGYIKQTHPVVE